MLRLIVGDLLANLRIWVGALVVAGATAAVLTVAAAEIETAVRTGGNTALALYAISGTVVLFATTTAVVVLGTIMNLAVTLQQRAYALWQLVGIGPLRVRFVVLTQLVVVALLGGAAGCAAVTPALPRLFRFFFDGASGLEHVRPRLSLVTAGGVVLLVALVVVLSGSGAAGRAGRVPAVRSLREPEPVPQRMGAARWVAAVAVLAALIGIGASLPGTAPERISGALMLVAPLTTVLLAALSPVLFRPFLWAWTALVPASASASWFLARHSAVDNVSRSTAAISPLMIAVGLTGGLYTAAAVGDTAAGSSEPPVAAGTVALLIGGPVLLAVLGSAATVLMSGRSREREFALVQAAGGTRGTVVGAAVCEALIYVGTAVALGAASVGVVTAAGLWLQHTWEFGTGAVGVIGVAGLLLTLAATVFPTVSALRHEVPRTLAAE